MKIAFFEVEDWQRDVITQELSEHEVLFFDNSLTMENVSEVKDVDAVAGFIYSRFSKEILSELSNLKLICTMSTGFDHIDLAHCKEKDIVVCNVPFYGENTVAEHTFSLILALSRQLYPSIKRTHELHRFDTDVSLRGFDLKKKTLGIIGGGSIGMHVVRMAKGFAMDVIVFDIHKDEALAQKEGFVYASLDDIFMQSDVISLHVPYNKHTHHILNAEAFSKMKHGVYIVNTARGGLIDTDALIKALHAKKVSACALDVLEEECHVKEELSLLKDEFKQTCNLKTLLQDHMLMKMDNVIITPHNAFNSHEALLRIINTTIENVKGFYGKHIVNRI